jgi:hypothetical protein
MNNLILLTGAGFTKNFGGFLDEGVKKVIENHIAEEEFKKIVKNNPNPYEQIYQELNSGNSMYSEDKRKQFNEAINYAYADMESSITAELQKFTDEEKNILQIFLKKFHYVFTLNQDLFLEKTFGYHSLLTNQFFGNYQSLNPFYDLLNGKFGHPDLVTSEFEKLLHVQPHKDNFKYFKIHGSFAWQNVNYTNIHVMGVGFSKHSRVWDYPVLRIYLSFFGNRITDGDGVLVIFGYGFGDMHINNNICWGINRGLRLIVIGWNEFENFKNKLKEAIEKTYSFDNIQLPTSENLKIQIHENTEKIINAIDKHYSLRDQNIFEFLKNFTQKL